MRGIIFFPPGLVGIGVPKLGGTSPLVPMPTGQGVCSYNYIYLNPFYVNVLLSKSPLVYLDFIVWNSLNVQKKMLRYYIVQAENSKTHLQLADAQCNESCWSFMEVEQHWHAWEIVYQPHILECSQIQIRFCSLPILFKIAGATFLLKLKGDFIWTKGKK